MGPQTALPSLPTVRYVELLGVEDGDKPGGAWLSEELADGDRLIGWAVRTDSVEDVARRTWQPAEVGSIERAVGTTGAWRTVAAPDGHRWRGGLPFFIQYDSIRSSERLRASLQGGIRWVEVGVADDELAGWIGDCDLDIRCDLHGSGLMEWESKSIGRSCCKPIGSRTVPEVAARRRTRRCSRPRHAVSSARRLSLEGRGRGR